MYMITIEEPPERASAILCNCTATDKCPLGRTMCDNRCTAAELEDFMDRRMPEHRNYALAKQRWDEAVVVKAER